MYKTITVSTKAYNHLNTLALRLQKPKSQVVELVLESYTGQVRNAEQEQLAQFNERLRKQVSTLNLPQNLYINTEDMDEQLHFIGKDIVDI